MHKDTKDKLIGVWVPLIIALGGILGNSYINYLNNSSIYNSQLNFRRFESTIGLDKELDESLNNLAIQEMALMEKYKISGKDWSRSFNKLTPEERNELRLSAVKINILLGEAFVFMKDDQYTILKQDYLMGPHSIEDMREALLVIFRKINNPNTTFNKVEDIRTFYIPFNNESEIMDNKK